MAYQHNSKSNIPKRILQISKTNYLILVCIIVISLLLGVLYSVFKKPIYTAQELAIYGANLSDYEESTYDMATTKAYLDTVSDFTDSGVVIDRANYYYEDYINNKGNYSNVEEYISATEKAELGKAYSYEELKAHEEEMKGKTIVLLTEGRTYKGGNGYTVSTLNQKLIGTFQGFAIVDDTINTKPIEEGTYQVECIKLQCEGSDEIKKLRGNRFFIKGVEKDITALMNEQKYIESIRNGVYPYSYIYKLEVRENIKEISGTEKHILRKNLSVMSSKTTDESITFSMKFSYSDSDKQSAVDKVKIIVFAINMEAKICAPYSRPLNTDDPNFNKLNNNAIISTYKYFGVKVNLSDMGLIGVSSSISKVRIILVAGIIGILICCVFIYIKFLFDRTIKSKEELEKITDTKCLSYIENNGGKK